MVVGLRSNLDGMLARPGGPVAFGVAVNNGILIILTFAEKICNLLSSMQPVWGRQNHGLYRSHLLPRLRAINLKDNVATRPNEF